MLQQAMSKSSRKDLPAESFKKQKLYPVKDTFCLSPIPQNISELEI